MFTLPRLTAPLAVVVPFAALLSTACDSNAPSGPQSLGAATAIRSAVTPSKSLAAALQASTLPSLGAASGFAVLGGTSVTCTQSAVTGAVGVSPGVSVTGFPPTSTLCTLSSGTVHLNDMTAQLASANFLTAYASFKGLTCDPANDLTGKELGGMTLSPGVYCFSTTADLTTGNLTLRGPANAAWVFQIGTGITTGTAAVIMAGGGQPCNVFWQVGSLATIGTGTAFQGNLLAGTAITFTGVGSSLVGRALAKAEVTMTGTNVSGSCTAGAPGGGGGNGEGDDDHGGKDHQDKNKHQDKDKHNDRDY
jgi:Ice-binding-like